MVLLNVPFYKQTTPLNCGPVALKMVLSFFGKDIDIKTLEEKTGTVDGKGVTTIHIAIAARELGFRTDFLSKHPTLNEENMEKDFYKKYQPINAEESRKLVEHAKNTGVNVQQKTLKLEEILRNVTNDTIPIILIDWNVVKDNAYGGFYGHFVPVVGYDDKNVYIHQHGLRFTQENMPIERSLFDKARKSDGTDEDVVFIHRK